MLIMLILQDLEKVTEVSEADVVAELEDYARIMHATIKEKNVPTWVLGREEEVKINGEFAGLALSMKIWPERDSAQKLISTEFNPLLDELIDAYCA